MIKKPNSLLDNVLIFIGYIVAATAAIALLMTLLVKFYMPPPPLPLPALKGNPQAVAIVTDNWVKFLNMCPGLSKYQDALTFGRLYDHLDLDPEWYSEEELGVEFTFKVSHHPDLIIPVEFMVYGHTCYYFISADGSELTISKSMCASLCVDEPLDHTGNISGNL